jgi:hypothetical protein
LSTLKDVMSAMKEVLLLTDNVDRAGAALSEISSELREHDRRLIRLETIVEIAKNQPPHSNSKIPPIKKIES